MSNPGEGLPWGWLGAVSGAFRPIPAARPEIPAPLRTPLAGPYYQENQMALARRRGGSRVNTCPSHALNAVMGGPVSNYEDQDAVNIEEFDALVASTGLPALQWQHFGPAALPPEDLEEIIGPHRAVVQITYLNPNTNTLAAHFLALRGDDEQGRWRSIDSRAADQPVVGTTLQEALNHYMTSLRGAIAQLSVGTWPPNTVLPVVSVDHDPLLTDLALIRQFRRGWVTFGGDRTHGDELSAISQWIDARRQAESADGTPNLSARIGSDMRGLLQRYVDQTMRHEPWWSENDLFDAQEEAIAAADMAVARLADFALIQEFDRHLLHTQEPRDRQQTMSRLTEFAWWLDSRDGLALNVRARMGAIQPTGLHASADRGELSDVQILEQDRWLARPGSVALTERVRMGVIQPTVIESYAAQLPAGEHGEPERPLSDDEILDLLIALEGLVAFIRSRPAQPANAAEGEDIPAAFQQAIEAGDLATIHRIYIDVGDAQWREHADAVLELLLLDNSDQNRRRDIAASVAYAFFADEVESIGWDGRTPAQQGHLLADLVFGGLNDPTLDLNDPRFGQRFVPTLQLLEDIDNEATESYQSHAAARQFLLSFMTDIITIDPSRIPDGGSEEIGPRGAVLALLRDPDGRPPRDGALRAFLRALAGQPPLGVAEVLPDAVEAGDVATIHRIRDDVEAAQWRENADAILAALLDDGMPHQRRDIATAIAYSFSADDAGPIEWASRSVEQRAYIAATLMLGNIVNPDFNRDDPRFAPFATLIRHMTGDMGGSDEHYVAASRLMRSLSDNPDGQNPEDAGSEDEGSQDEPPSDEEDIAETLQDAVEVGDVTTLSRIRDGVEDAQWRENADAVLAALLDDGTPRQRLRIADAVAGAFFADDAETIEWEDRTGPGTRPSYGRPGVWRLGWTGGPPRSSALQSGHAAGPVYRRRSARKP